MTGFPPGDILDQAASQVPRNEVARLLITDHKAIDLFWQILEELGNATPGEISRLFGQELSVVHQALIMKGNPLIYEHVLRAVQQNLNSEENLGNMGHSTGLWKRRAEELEKRIHKITAELDMVRRIAAEGGNWERINEYLETGR